MKGKVACVSVFLCSVFLSLSPLSWFEIVIPVGIGWFAVGVMSSRKNGFNPLNDAPNAMRVSLASLGGCILTEGGFLFVCSGLILLGLGIVLNDEWVRATVASVREGRRGGTIALLGIDGSGKSSHADATGDWLETRGYNVSLVRFHKYLFVEGISSIARGTDAKAKGRNPLRPVLSLIDNLILQATTSVGCRLRGRVVVYDRFIWSTYVKYRGLHYPVSFLRRAYMGPRPTVAVVLDVPVGKSLQVIGERPTHIRYPQAVLEVERREYLDIARRMGYAVIDSTGPFKEVQDMIEIHLSSAFPSKEMALVLPS